MFIHSFQIQGYRSFIDSGIVKLSPINVFFGPNNSGKSTILKALHLMQRTEQQDSGVDVRHGSNEARISLELTRAPGDWKLRESISRPFDFEESKPIKFITDGKLTIRIQPGSSATMDFANGAIGNSVAQIHNSGPDHIIVPFLSKRKTGEYNENVGSSAASQIHTDMRFLAAKLARIANPTYPGSQQYRDACKQILGFEVTAIQTESGQCPGIYLPDGSTLRIDQMGEGVPNIVFLLVELALSNDKLFLIEEPENDLHPRALRSLLDLIADASERNQFFISTHSNIVVSHLCAHKSSSLLRINAGGSLPTSATIAPVAPTPEARIAVLQELGYSFSEFNLWEGWLILEESSAERIIRDYLVPWFVPKLARVRTVAAGSVSKIQPLVEDFQRLILFTHLEPSYRKRTWVRMDGGRIGVQTVSKLQEKFKDWPRDRIGYYEASDFELYYPEAFADRVPEVLGIGDKQAKREAKRNLLLEVISWLDADSDRAKAALEKSAKHVIDDLRSIEASLFN